MKIVNRITALLLICLISFNICFEYKVKAEVLTVLGISAIAALLVSAGVVYTATQKQEATNFATSIYNDTLTPIGDWARGVAVDMVATGAAVKAGIQVPYNIWLAMQGKLSEQPQVDTNGDSIVDSVKISDSLVEEYYDGYPLMPSSIIGTDINSIISNGVDIGENAECSSFRVEVERVPFDSTSESLRVSLYNLMGEFVSSDNSIVFIGEPAVYYIKLNSLGDKVYLYYTCKKTNGIIYTNLVGFIPVNASDYIKDYDQTPVTYVFNNTFDSESDSITVPATIDDSIGKTSADVVTVNGLVDTPIPTTAPDDTLGILTGINTFLTGALLNTLTGINTGIGTMTGTLTGVGTAVGSIATTVSNVFSTDWWTVRDINFNGLKNLIVFSKFPFCIPFDLINTIRLFAVSATAPVFAIAFSTAYFTVNHTVDLAPYSMYIAFFRYFVVAVYTMFLISKTSQFIKW